MIVDFHCHSTASDGTCAPGELAARAQAGGFAALALTDHDNCDGIGGLWGGDATGRRISKRSGTLATANGTRLVAGIELSIEPGTGFDKFHLLGLGIDPANAGLQAFLKRILEGRNARNKRILANFRRLGIEMEYPEPVASGGSDQPDGDTVFAYAHGDVLARPHFAAWLVKHAYAPDIKTAFATYLLPESPAETRCYEERYHPSQEEAFRIVHEAGGLCVMAHPKYWRRYWKETGPEYADAERELARLKEAGLDGLEALYQANTGGENVEFTRLAVKLGLLKTAGSDFHGAHKPTIPLGMTVSDSFIQPFLEALDLL